MKQLFSRFLFAVILLTGLGACKKETNGIRIRFINTSGTDITHCWGILKMMPVRATFFLKNLAWIPVFLTADLLGYKAVFKENALLGFTGAVLKNQL
jgi:hypothetical protein